MLAVQSKRVLQHLCKKLQIVMYAMLCNIERAYGSVTSNNAEEKQQFSNWWHLKDSTKVGLICQG
jgi:hypothetical protein